MAHSKIVGGSTAKRVIACPASVKLCQQMPEQQENDAMALGTLCHNAIEAVVGTDTPRRCIGMKYKDLVLTEDIYEAKIAPAVRMFNEVVDPDMSLEFVTEAECDFGAFLPGVFGTTDLLGRSGSCATVLDWKFGDPYHGVKVDAEENEQGMFYAAAARRTPKLKWAFDGVKQVEIIIIQPPMISRWVCPIERIDAFELQLKQAIKQSEMANPPFHHGEHCRFCTGKPICPKMTGAADRALKTSLEGLDAAAINSYLKNADLLEQWITDLRALAFRMMEEGNIKLPDWKLVPKRATRKWKDELMAGSYLIDALGAQAAFKSEVISPAVAEKLLKKAKLELPSEMVVSVSSGNTLAPKDDPRPEALQIGQQLTAALSKIV